MSLKVGRLLGTRSVQDAGEDEAKTRRRQGEGEDVGERHTRRLHVFKVQVLKLHYFAFVYMSYHDGGSTGWFFGNQTSGMRSPLGRDAGPIAGIRCNAGLEDCMTDDPVGDIWLETLHLSPPVRP